MHIRGTLEQVASPNGVRECGIERLPTLDEVGQEGLTEPDPA
jgi:hypothetical protein